MLINQRGINKKLTHTINLYGFYLNIIDIYCTFASEILNEYTS